MEAIITAMADVADIVTSAFGLITGTPVLLFFLAASLVPVGFRIFRMAKRSAK